MKPILSLVALSLVATSAFAAAPHMTPATGRGRVSMSNQMMMAPRGVPAVKQVAGTVPTAPNVAPSVPDTNVTPDVPSDDKLAVTPDEMKPAVKDMREREKNACLQNNIGIGNTFVWASRYSNLGNYSTMIEDVEEPENNTCFVKVELKSDDPKISVADVPSKYFEMGHDITCGEWVNYDMLKGRILDAKKSARTWATVGGAVGGAAVGVGAMELFGNRWIGGEVEGQKSKELSDLDLLKSQLAVLKAENVSDYNNFIKYLGELKCACNSSVWTSDEQKPDACDEYKDAFELPGVNLLKCAI